MLTTEQEAKMKACPQTRCAPASNFDHGGCVASECMAWRWLCWVNDEGEVRYTTTSGLDTKDAVLTRVGYCGLAGSAEPERR